MTVNELCGYFLKMVGKFDSDSDNVKVFCARWQNYAYAQFFK